MLTHIHKNWHVGNFVRANRDKDMFGASLLDLVNYDFFAD
jgi:hypothetical protein